MNSSVPAHQDPKRILNFDGSKANPNNQMQLKSIILSSESIFDLASLELWCGRVWIWLSWMPSNLYRYVNRASQRCEEAMWRCGVGRGGGLSWNVTSDHLHLGGYLIWDPSMGSAKMSSWICEHSPNQERDWFVCIYFDLSKTRVFALLRPYALHCTNFRDPL